MRTIRKQAVSTVLIYVTVLTMIFSVFGTNSVNAAGQKLDGLLDVHTTKVYDNFTNIGGYVRPSAATILNDFKSKSKDQHPRIMIDSSSVSALKKDLSNKNDPKYDIFYNKDTGIVSRANQLCKQLSGSDKAKYMFKYSKCYETRMPATVGGNAADVFLDRMLILGLSYQITGDSKYADAAWEILKVITDDSFKDINPWHNLDFGMFCQGYAIAYDWMYSAWDDTKKATIEKAIVRQCFRPANDSYTDNHPNKNQTSDNGLLYGTFINHNHNSFVNSGVVMVSLALMDKYPEITSSLCHDALICSELLLNEFAPGGLSTEGTMYQSLIIDNLSMMFSSLEKSTGKLYGLDTCPGLKDGKAMRVLHGFESDCGMFCFGDTYDSLITQPGELYFDAHYDLHGFRTDIFNRVKSIKDFTRKVKLLCWYVPDTSGQGISIDKDMVMNYGGANGVLATFRNKFGSGQSYVGVKAGTTTKTYFTHMDEGSFVFHSQGIKWATDLGKDNYDITGYSAPTGAANDRWKIFRIRPDGHNVLLIDPNPSDYGYLFNKTATLTTETSDTQAKAVIDMSALVSDKANSFQRGFLLTDDRLSLVVRDEVSLKGTSDLYWVMYTEQNVSVSGNVATLTAKKDSKKQVKLEFSSSVSGTLYVEDASPWDLAPTVTGPVKQEENDDYNRIVFKISGAKGNVNITAKFTPVIEETKTAPSVSTYGAISTWKINGSSTTPDPSDPTTSPTATTTTTTAPSTTAPSTTSPTNPNSGGNTGNNTGTEKTTEVSFEDFVERLYVVALNRASEPEGKAFWCEHVGNGDLTGAACANEFLLSKEFNDRNLSDEDFLKVLYKTFFDRDAEDDKDGFNFWMNSLKTEGRDKVVDGFINSTEWCNICASYVVKSGATRAKATIASKNATAFATRLYTECLGRDPETEGLNFWSIGLTNLELTGKQAAHEFFFSKEFNDFNLDNEGLLTRMYKTFMGREPDTDGMNFWLYNMKNGMTKEDVFNEFVKSKEFTQICKDYAIDRG